jgi:hypothetical protein
VVGCRFTESGPGLLLYCISASEGYLDVCLFEKVGDFSDFMAVVCVGGPFLGFVDGVVGVCFLLCTSFQSCYEVDGEIVVLRYGEDLCHSVFSLSVVRGSDVILSETCRVLLQLIINILPSCITLVLYTYIYINI